MSPSLVPMPLTRRRRRCASAANFFWYGFGTATRLRLRTGRRTEGRPRRRRHARRAFEGRRRERHGDNRLRRLLAPALAGRERLPAPAQPSKESERDPERPREHRGPVSENRNGDDPRRGQHTRGAVGEPSERLRARAVALHLHRRGPEEALVERDGEHAEGHERPEREADLDQVEHAPTERSPGVTRAPAEHEQPADEDRADFDADLRETDREQQPVPPSKRRPLVGAEDEREHEEHQQQAPEEDRRSHARTARAEQPLGGGYGDWGRRVDAGGAEIDGRCVKERRQPRGLAPGERDRLGAGNDRHGDGAPLLANGLRGAVDRESQNGRQTR